MAETKTNVIPIDGVTPASFKHILDYLYTQAVPELRSASRDEVLNMWQVMQTRPAAVDLTWAADPA